ncbi:MFS transporter, sugar porter (SP) family [Ferrimonas marina]|uniref:D-xylose-proton symporter n=2 Tax=Ferrimonas marina TaxID=299255 RepID=A0A1M5YC41_9GAMM|nr:MFS transporter, sugar porter (SP) family [Ferrimonas marina]
MTHSKAATGPHSQSMAETEENTLFIVLISCIAALGGFLFGFDSGVINGTIDGLQQAFNANDIGTGFNVASMLLGCALGAFFAGRLADAFGRKTILIVAALLFLVSAYGSGAAGSSMAFIVYRILGGLAVGAASVMTPAYISEVAPARYRGTLTSIQQVAIVLGLFAAFLSNYILASYAGGSTATLWLDITAWRWMFWMEIIPAALFFIGLLLIPESPRYLIAQRKLGQASGVLAKLYGSVTGKQKEQEIEASLAEDHHAPSFRDLLDRAGKVKKVVWIGIGLAMLQQLVGINVVMYYGAVMWQAAGFTEQDALLINILGPMVSIVACIITIGYVDRIGRKPFLYLGGIGMGIMLAVLAWVFGTSDVAADGTLDLGSNGWVALLAANAYVFLFNMTWGPVMWVMLGEMFPNQIRGTGLAVAGLAQWLANFLITMSFPVMLAGLGLALSYSFYAFFSFVAFLFVFKFVKETKGIELEKMTDA